MRKIYALASLAWQYYISGWSVQAQMHIVPGATLTAVNTGQHVQAHGAGFIKVNNLYYMIGEDKTNGSSFSNVNCYASTDLVEWAYVGALLSLGQADDLGPGRVVERPKVIYNKSTAKFVMYMHIDSNNYQEAKVGVATSDFACGKYKYIGSYRPMNMQSRDMGLFQEHDGTAYLLSEDRENGLHIYQLTPDYLGVNSLVYTWKEKYESPAILKQDGRYFMFSSHLTGWQPNDNLYSTASQLFGPWSPWKNFAPVSSNTFDSQTTYILPVGDSIIYMGDRWTAQDLRRSTYIWLPLSINGTDVKLTNKEFWNTPVLSRPRGTDMEYMANQGILQGGAKLLPGKGAGYLGGPKNGNITFDKIQCESAHRASLKIYYQNNDRESRYASVVVNGDPPTSVAFLSTAGSTGISVISVNLMSGQNTITISGQGQGYAPDLLSLKVTV